ncbi:Mitochondrial distribution and morphology protein 12 [Coemansia sp. S2]|nr:Mitochondrial distribution and morphology protein 12 [Coemansia sp. S680]KAJ2031621.1 Mitochondrial distribution and morphology protein 12 [Coemansia sp. S3946]KAJ2039527.1 Mitochondrial distribution and morphology protein 12 [Coemansia sp. S2]KAJ2071487.1 Mitochondrial distribution and morphology protein 12 [Coemansia sp. S155-1]
MSFQIFWEKLDRKVALSVQAQLNSFFASLEPRPSFLGEISVEQLDFGSVPPQFEIIDLTGPFPEFYLATEDDVVSSAPRPLSPATQRSYFGSQADTAYQTPILPGELAVERGEDDMQLVAKVEYCGDMSLVLRTELQLNYPATQFASLPVTLHITRIEFSATAVIAYLPDRVNLCFLEPEPPHTSLLRSFAIRTEVGDAHQHVLKNVEKLELFITEQLRQAIDEDFVFPSYHSFEAF